ncbi:MAG: acetyl-CoA carboxylase biotin carboxylase subunit [Acidobacteriota bacterium]|nr:acetyl-CoA carboxylase biotin carboxylase subunit [Acidobacteriota bacterium]MDQ7087198.1 acetyl-CoA carboxylase biotin carboxylase subunit [Acidobacteriota bacterium]
MFEKILIANRGEIALRIIWACKELGIRTVAVHSDADQDSLHVRFADEDVCIGPARSTDSYLNIGAIISAAEITGADAIHPGYGFLAENPHFAEICAECGLSFIGPQAATIRQMGDKAAARAAMISAGVPVIPGSRGTLESFEEAAELAKAIGYPVIVKAAAGGGGRGMRVVERPEDLESAVETCRSEALAGFGSGELYLEKFIVRPRHIEFQILGDLHGNIVHLFERECSLQRRHQKVIEEAPSPALDEALRVEMGRAAVQAARAVEYQNAGTVEFLLDEDRSFYFMEMNTRIQVEHPVTENVAGLDLLKEQIRIAAGEPLGYGQDDLEPRGWSIEARVTAEDPWTFRPCPGPITTFHPPGGPGVRIDTAAYAGYQVSPHYDSMIAKLIVRGRDRDEALSRLGRALDFFVIEGITTNLPLLKELVAEPGFRDGDFSTRFMEEFLARRKARGA